MSGTAGASSVPGARGGRNLELGNSGILYSLDQPDLPCVLNLSSPEVHLALAPLRCFPSQEDTVAARLGEIRIWKELDNQVRDFMLWAKNHREKGWEKHFLFFKNLINMHRE